MVDVIEMHTVHAMSFAAGAVYQNFGGIKEKYAFLSKRYCKMKKVVVLYSQKG